MANIRLKKILSLLICLVMLCGILPTVALATEPDEGETSTGEKAGECSCVEKCTEDGVNNECTICSAEGAELSVCKGKSLYPACEHHNHDEDCGGLNNACSFVCQDCIVKINSMLIELPDTLNISAGNRDAVIAALGAIDGIKAKLSDAAIAAVDWTKYSIATMGLQKPEGWFGFYFSKAYEAGTDGPLASFSFMGSDGPATLIGADMLSTSSSASPTPNGDSVLYYLPSGTYSVVESVEGNWDMSLSVNGSPVSGSSFTGDAGQIYELMVTNSFARIDLNNCVVTLPEETITYDGTAKEPEIKVTAQDAPVPSDFYTVIYANNINAGENTASITITGKEPYSTGENTVFFSIAKRDITLSDIEAEDKVYDGTTAATVSGTFLASDLPDGHELNLGTALAGFADPNAGNSKKISITFPDATVTFNGEDITGNFNFVTDVAASISPKPITITPQEAGKNYLEMDPVLKYDVEGLVDGEKLEGYLGRWSGEVVGEYPIVLGSIQTKNPNYDITLVPANFSIQPLSITVSGITADNKTYDGTTDAKLNMDEVKINYTDSERSFSITDATAHFPDPNAGTDKTVTVTDIVFNVTGDDAKNFVLVNDDTITADILPLELKVTVTNNTKIYGESDPDQFTYETDPATDIDGSAFELSIGRAEGEDANSYDFTADASDNYSFVFQNKFVIEAIDIAAVLLDIQVDSPVEYTGNEIDGIKSLSFDTDLEEGTDYTIEGNMQSKLGTHTITLNGKGNYTGSYTASYFIVPPSIIEDLISGEISKDNATLDQLDDLKLLESALASVDEDTSASDEEKLKWQDAADKLPDILDSLETLEAREALEKLLNSDDIKAVWNIKADSVKPEDREKLEKAKADIEQLLTDHGSRLSDEQKTDPENILEDVNAALDVLDKIDDKIAEIEKWLKDNESKFGPDQSKLREEYNDFMDEIGKLDTNSKAAVNAAIGAKLEAARVKLYTYKLTLGDGSTWIKGSTAGLSFSANGDIKQFNLMVDGNIVPKTSYTVPAGSTVVTLNPAYLNTLYLGWHSVQFVYTDGSSNLGHFLVSSSTTSTINGVRTGDDADTELWMGLILMSFGGMAVTVPALRRRKSKN